MMAGMVVNHWHNLRGQWWLMWSAIFIIVLSWIQDRVDDVLKDADDDGDADLPDLAGTAIFALERLRTLGYGVNAILFQPEDEQTGDVVHARVLWKVGLIRNGRIDDEVVRVAGIDEDLNRAAAQAISNLHAELGRRGDDYYAERVSIRVLDVMANMS